MNAITIKQLESQVDHINRAKNAPAKPYINGKAQVGNYHLSGAYGGYALHVIRSTSGGVSDVFSSGHITKRDLSNRIAAYLAAID